MFKSAREGRATYALSVSVWWGDALVHEWMAPPGAPIRLLPHEGGADLRDAGGFPSDRLTLATYDGDTPQVMVPKGANVLAGGPAQRAAQVPFPADWVALSRSRPVQYKMGPFRVQARLRRPGARVGRWPLLDWNFPRFVAIAALVHAFFIVMALMTPPAGARTRAMSLRPYAVRLAPPPAPVTPPPPAPPPRPVVVVRGVGGRSDRPRVRPVDDRQAALDSGLLAALRAGGAGDAVSRVFGHDGFAESLNQRLDALTGPAVASAGTSDGLATRGRGMAGDGGSVGLGDGWGHRRAYGGPVDLGHRGRGPGVRIRPGRTVLIGSLTKDEVARVIRRNLARFKFCYERALASAPNLAGKVALRFTILPDGRVAKVTVDESSLEDAPVEGCVQKVMRSLRFNRPRGGGIVVVRYPFVFSST